HAGQSGQGTGTNAGVLVGPLALKSHHHANGEGKRNACRPGAGRQRIHALQNMRNAVIASVPAKGPPWRLARPGQELLAPPPRARPTPRRPAPKDPEEQRRRARFAEAW